MAVCSDTYMAMQNGLNQKINELKEENEQLKAQVNELLDQLQYIASQYSNCGCGHPACRRCQDQRENDEIIARIEKGLK